MKPGPLQPILEADRTLCEVALKVDFLLAVTPVDVPQAWRRFHGAGYRIEPVFNYRAPSPEIPELYERIEGLDLSPVEDPILGPLLENKREELRTQLDCLQFRNSPRFLESSIALYGGVDGGLLEIAELILASRAPSGPASRRPHERRVGARAFAKRAHRELLRYQQDFPELASKVQILDEIPGIMAFEGDVLVGRDLSLPLARVEALIQHEVGTHVVTYANGGTHPLRMLQVGLPGYEETQEALAVFSEYAVGGLTEARLAQLASRVVAVDGLLRGGSFIEVFNVLRRRHRIPPKSAFQVVSRVFRAGGLTKDAVYLRGVAGLLTYLQDGGDLEPLFVGKLPVSSVQIIPHLRELGLVTPAPLRPRWADDPGAQPRIAAARRGLGVAELTTKEAA